MVKKTLAFLLAVCLLVSTIPAAAAAPAAGGPSARDGSITIPTATEATQIMENLKATYPEGKTWTNANEYKWKGGNGETGAVIAETGAGCVAFAYILSDAVFNELPARMLSKGNFKFEDVRVGDILRVNGDAHTVIVLQVVGDSVIVAEGNYSGKIHWGRGMTKDEVNAADHFITRYPKGYIPTDDPEANEPMDANSNGDISDSQLKWELTKSGTLTISGTGAMPDFSFGSSESDILSDRPWNDYTDKILKVVIGDGVTTIGNNAFRKCPTYSISFPGSIKEIRGSAFRESKIVSVSLPNGVETIGDSAFSGCTQLTAVNLPASIIEVGNAAFSECTNMKSVAFAPSGNQVTMGNQTFMRCQRLVSVTLPQKMDCIGDEMFLNCLLLTNLTIPDGVSKIGEKAFSSCGILVSLTIPASVTEQIGRAAFASAPLTNIYFGGTQEQWASISKIAQLGSNSTVHYNSTGPDGEQPTPPTPVPLTAEDFDYTAPANLTYDGSGKAANVRPKDSLSGDVGTITVKYYQGSEEHGSTTAPTSVGTYNVKIDVEATASYEAATGLVMGSFTIKPRALAGSLVVSASDSGGEGKITTGTVLTAHANANVVAGDSLSYQWYRDGKEIEGATKATYTLTTADTDESVITVKATGGTNYSEELASNAVTVGKKAMTATLALSAAEAEGSTVLTASITDGENDIAYDALAGKGLKLVWTRSGEEFSNEAVAYPVQNSDRGKAITAKLVPAEGSDYTGEVVATGTGTNLVNGVYTLPAVVPGAPTILTATPGDGKVALTWTAPEDNGGAEITGYEITANDSVVEVGNVTSYTVSDLDNGTEYRFTVQAVNSVGTGAASNGVTATPKAGSTPTPPSGGDRPSNPKPPVDPTPPPATGEDVTQTVTPNIKDGTASATVDKETADKLVSDAVDNESENVTVKVEVPAGADVREVKADIPASAVAGLAAKTDANLTVDTPVGNVTLPKETLAQLGGTSGNVTITAAVNEDNSVKVEVQANGTTVGALDGGMKVDLPVRQPTAGTVAVLVDAEGNETILPKSAVDGGEMAVLLEDGSATLKFEDRAKSFSDTEGHWAKNSIAFVSSRNLFQGMEGNRFKADEPMNRAMLVTVLHRLESTPAAGSVSFDDVPADGYYANAAAWAAGKGIVTGDASGFNGQRNITRQEMAVMLYRYVQTIHGNQGTLGSYDGMDGAEDVSSWAARAMGWAVGSGIIRGDDSGSLNPSGTATRGEVAQMLMNFVSLITQ